MPYQYLEDVTYADVAFNAWGSSIEECFQAAADATLQVMIDDLNTLAAKTQHTLQLESEERLLESALEDLLYNLLQKIIYFKDADGLLMRISQVQLSQSQEPAKYKLTAVATGDPLDPTRHSLGTDVKGVTFHRFSIQKINHLWQATVVLDT